MNIKQKKSRRELLIVMAICLVVFVLLANREKWFYDHFGWKYTVAKSIGFKSSSKGGFYKFIYFVNEKEYSGVLSLGRKIKYGDINVSDKYLIRIPVIAPWDGKTFNLYQLPDTTSLPKQPWDTIPSWVFEIPREWNGRISPEYYN